MNKNDKQKFTCGGEVLKEVGLRIRHVRRVERRISQERLAEMVGLSMNTINRYERGHRSPTVDEVVRIADALECDPCWLITGRCCFESALIERDEQKS